MPAHLSYRKTSCIIDLYAVTIVRREMAQDQKNASYNRRSVCYWPEVPELRFVGRRT